MIKFKIFRIIKNYKRHKRNEYIKNKASDVYYLAYNNLKMWNDRMFIVNSLVYEIIRANYDTIPENLYCSTLISKNIDFVMTVDGREYGIDKVIKPLIK